MSIILTVRVTFKKIGLMLAILTVAQGLRAAEFEVGRAKVVLAGDGWQVLDMADGGKPYNGGVQAKIQSETKVFLKLGADKTVQTVVLIRASQAGMANGWMVYSHDCKGNDQMYAVGNTGARTNNYDCLSVWGLYRTSEWVDDLFPELNNKLKAQQLQLPKAVQPISMHFANANGSFAEARVLLAPGFTGVATQAAADFGTLPKGVLPSAVGWGQELAKAVRGSVSSLSGRLEVPAIEYTADGTPPAKVASN